MIKLTRAWISGHRTLYISLSNATLDTLGEWWGLIYLLYVSLDQMPTRISDRYVPWASTRHPGLSLGRDWDCVTPPTHTHTMS